MQSPCYHDIRQLPHQSMFHATCKGSASSGWQVKSPTFALYNSTPSSPNCFLELQTECGLTLGMIRQSQLLQSHSDPPSKHQGYHANANRQNPRKTPQRQTSRNQRDQGKRARADVDALLRALMIQFPCPPEEDLLEAQIPPYRHQAHTDM